jgi:2-polyprenyl-6-methoxyphenol hydroxylase-like FAD-dependent oxidoreductase
VFRVIFGRGARFLHYRVDEKTVYWEGIYATSAGVQDPAGGRRQAALDRFAGWRTPVEAIIGATNETAINRSDIYTRPPIKEWGAGRVTLLGDAAHPMTNAMGQGANQAIEDAVVLARCLSQVDDPMSALREYERCRIGRSASFVKISSFMSKLSQLQQPAAVGARDLWFRVSLGTFVYRKVRKDMAYTF